MMSRRLRQGGAGSRVWRVLGLLSLMLGGTVATTHASAEDLPAASVNAALHYQRASLHLARLPPADTAVLDRPIWEIVSGDPDARMSAGHQDLLLAGQSALRAASLGSRQPMCDFGIDFSMLGPATELPHVAPMVRLGRLLLLRGAFSVSEANWGEAAAVYFDVLQMGRHMAHQPTLLEARAGLAILGEAYDRLAHWAVACPHKRFTARAFGRLESLAGDMTQPSRTIAREAAILARQLELLGDAYPDGAWAEMILTASGLQLWVRESGGLEEQAVKTAVERGVPDSVFSDPASFHDYLLSLKTHTKRFGEAAAACLALPPCVAIVRGRALYERYTTRLGPIAADTIFDPAEAAQAFAGHAAALTLVRVVLALAASRDAGRFPEDLGEVAGRFGGTVPRSPYNGQPLLYERQREGEAFALHVPAARDEALGLDRLGFHSHGPEAASESPGTEEGRDEETPK